MVARHMRLGPVLVSFALATVAILVWLPEPSRAAGALVATYDFSANGGSTLEDTSGAGHDGTIEGATWTTNGRYGNALAFDGIDDRVSVPHSSALDLSTGFTIEAWVNWAGAAQWQTLVLKEGPGQETYGIWVSPQGRVDAWAQLGTGIGYGALSATHLTPGTWTHVASTYDGATLRLYINGVVEAVHTFGGPVMTSTEPFRLGGDEIYHQYFAGRIDEVRIFDGARTTAEIVADMDASLDQTLPPVVNRTVPGDGKNGAAIDASVSAFFSKPMNGATVSAATFELQDASGPVAATVSYDAATRRALLTPAAPLNSLTTYTATVRGGPSGITDAGGVSLPADVIWTFTTRGLPEDPVAAYNFAEGSGPSTADVSGNGHTGAVEGATWTTGGRYGNALTFDGVDDRVTVPDTDLLDLSTAFTLELWVYRAGAAQWQALLIKEDFEHETYGIFMSPEGRIDPWIVTPSGISHGVFSTTLVPPDTWTHVAATYDGTTLRVYIDGVEEDSKVIGEAVATSTRPFRLGGDGIYHQYFAGRLDEVRLYSRALSAAEILEDMNTPMAVSGPASVDVALVLPVEGPTFSGAPIGLLATASTTSGTITNVTFYAGTTPIGSANTEPYTATWSSPPEGNHVLTATASNSTGQSATSTPVHITVRTLPVISGVSPTSAAAGTLVTVTGTGFGATQGTSSVWLGTRVGVVETWTDTLITARIAAGASSGTAQVRLPDRMSNAIPLTVLTPVISNATPGSGGAGTAVTISGANFGTAQGTGHVWLGTAAGVVTSWSDTQIVATIAAGSQTGTVQVLQNGVASNSVPLTITGAAPRITWLSPGQGGSGTIVTLYGSGFGPTQGGGVVRLGNALAGVTSWSDTQVSVSVPMNAVSGVVKLQQGGLWSNAVAFRVPAPAGLAAVVSPSALSMVVGETRTLQALDNDGELVTGATWTSSDTDVVSLSTADPPVLTAAAPGTVTISVGGASAEVTVYAGPSLPLGTVIWTNGVDAGNGVYPAVPNYDAVADVFALGANSEVVAITADGTTAWTHQGLNNPWLFPDFQGGVVAYDTGETLWRLDPLTGQPLQLFAYTSSEGQAMGYAEPRIHPDGTVFTTDYACTNLDCTGSSDGETGAWIVGVDSKTAATKFRVPLQNWSFMTTITPTDESFCQTTGGTWTGHAWPASWAAIIGGDGRYYVSYTTDQGSGTVQRSAAQVYPEPAHDLWEQLVVQVVNSEFAAARATHAALRAVTGESYTAWDSQLDAALDAGNRTSAITLLNQQNLKYKRLCDQSWSSVLALHVMQVGPDGSSSDVVVKTWERTETSAYILASGPEAPWGYRQTKSYTGTYDVDVDRPNFITDADQGALMSWLADEDCSNSGPNDLVLVNTCVEATDHHLTLLRNGALASDVVWEQAGLHPVRLELQLEDGSFVGTQHDASLNVSTVVFSATGATKWTLPGYWPQQTVAGGGLVAISSDNSTFEFDAQGAAVRQIAALPWYTSWSQDAYANSSGIVEAVELPGVPWGTTFAATQGGNPSSYGTFIGVAPNAHGIPQYKKMDWGGSCRLPSPGAAGKVSLSTDVLANLRYQLIKSALLAPDAPFSSDACNQSLLAINISRENLRSTIDQLNVYNGLLSTISQYDAGMVLPSRLANPNYVATMKGAPVCEVFLVRGRDKRLSTINQTTVAAGQAVEWSGLPRLDIYVNAYPDVMWKKFSQGTIVHEALHNLTGLGHTPYGDLSPSLDGLLGAPSPVSMFPPSYPGESDVTRRIREMGCAAK